MADIPEHARHAFKGILFDVYQWEQRLFDGSTTTFEAVKRVPTVQILATTPEQKVILLREEQPYVGAFTAVPGGRIERGDTPRQTVDRELLEELGMTAGRVQQWKKYTIGSSIHWETYDFFARDCRQIQAPDQEPGERIEAVLVTFDEFLEAVEEPGFRNRRLTEELFRMRHTPGALARFRRVLFGKD